MNNVFDKSKLLLPLWFNILYHSSKIFSLIYISSPTPTVITFLTMASNGIVSTVISC